MLTAASKMPMFLKSPGVAELADALDSKSVASPPNENVKGGTDRWFATMTLKQ